MYVCIYVYIYICIYIYPIELMGWTPSGRKEGVNPDSIKPMGKEVAISFVAVPKKTHAIGPAGLGPGGWRSGNSIDHVSQQKAHGLFGVLFG